MMASIPDGAACYFCLGEKGDEEGKPLLRDCSCRGNSGFAHLPCLIEYSKQKCKQAVDFCEPWGTCNNCKQPFQDQLSINLASAFISFAEATYGHPDSSKWDKMKVMAAIRWKIIALTQLPDKDTVKVTKICNKLLSTIDQTKKDFDMSRWIHMPKNSEEYQYYTLMCADYEVFAYRQLGAMLMSETSGEGFNVASMHFKLARVIYNLLGMKDLVKEMDAVISMCIVDKQVANDSDGISCTVTITNSGLVAIRNLYEFSIDAHGIESIFTIRSGLDLAIALCGIEAGNMSHCIEAERLTMKVAAASRQVHGPNHKITIEAVKILKKCRERYISIYPEIKYFQALRYENDGEICVVTGPITKPRQIDDERIFNVEWNLVVPANGCPVICHGLVSASHLNGELGEVRHLKEDETGMRCAVSFEKKGEKSALVKPANLRIAFELPSK